MKKSSLAVATLLAALSTMPVASVAYAEDSTTAPASGTTDSGSSTDSTTPCAGSCSGSCSGKDCSGS